EVALRAKRLLEEMVVPQPPAEIRAIVQVTCARQPKGYVEVLLHYLPMAEVDGVDEIIWFTLEERTEKAGRIDPLIANSLQNPVEIRRALAACLIGRWGDAAQRAKLAERLKTETPLVRLRAAQGLLARYDDAAIPILLDLLGGDATIALQAA